MRRRFIGWITITIIVLSLQLFTGAAQAAPENPLQVKELNLVYLHGLGGTSEALQLLDDSIQEETKAYISDYEKANPGITVQVNTLMRSYPNDVDLDSWAKNIADAIDKHFSNKNNLVLIGHSMGGKAALYAVAHDVNGLFDKVSMVVTINSPVKNLNQYFVTGGGSAADYCRVGWLLSDHGSCDSLGFYDSSADGKAVGTKKHWLAFVSSESAPLSPQFNPKGIDGYPRDMDDGLVPISAQYSDGADVAYYGEHGHSDFSDDDKIAEYIADQILHYIFGGTMEFSIPTERHGNFEYKAGWLPFKNLFDDAFGEVLASSGNVTHRNESFFSWQNWQDVVTGNCPTGSIRSSYTVRKMTPPWLTVIQEVRWLNSNNEDCNLLINTRAAPKNTVEIQWKIFRHDLLPAGVERDHYEIKMLAGTPQAAITLASWESDDTSDTRLQIHSEVQGPFRWLTAEWKIFSKETRQRKVIDEIPAHY